ncbi:hypothetical protein [Sorangium sp. So ce388]|uniref:hypothetical protein n=1 Tax=Sorangium sp. So ce388 TaxID=3133309 RepID=UPI003F5BE83A
MSGPGEKLWGWKAIAARLGIAENTAIAYSRLCEDPLPVRMQRGSPWCHERYLDEWLARRSGGVMRDGSALERLDGWPAICHELFGADRATAFRWARLPHDRLPVIGIGGRQPWAYKAAIRDWKNRGDLPFQAHERADAEVFATSAAKRRANKARSPRRLRHKQH